MACRRTPRLREQKKSELDDDDELQEEESSPWLSVSLLDSTTNDTGEIVRIDREGIVNLFCGK